LNRIDRQIVHIHGDSARLTEPDLGIDKRWMLPDQIAKPKFPARFLIGATGEEKLLRAITVQVDSSFMVEASDNPAKYMVGHSLNLILINPQLELVAILRPPHTVKSILNALRHFKAIKQ